MSDGGFTRCNLKGAKLRRIFAYFGFVDCNLNRVSLSYTDLSSSSFYHCTIEGTFLKETNFCRAKF
ncbi:pentapeptide repeat-containing protein [Coleofasciculus sp. FACHB-129]|nr:pentapeptide repeat-containing protein [Coleofasciculus sp. FACHB-129]